MKSDYKCVEELFISCSSFVCEGVIVFVWRPSLDCLLWTDVSLVKMCLVEVLMNGWWFVMHGKYLIFLFWSVSQNVQILLRTLLWLNVLISSLKFCHLLSIQTKPFPCVFSPWNIKWEIEEYTLYTYMENIDFPIWFSIRAAQFEGFFFVSVFFLLLVWFLKMLFFFIIILYPGLLCLCVGLHNLANILWLSINKYINICINKIVIAKKKQKWEKIIILLLQYFSFNNKCLSVLIWDLKRFGSLVKAPQSHIGEQS